MQRICVFCGSSIGARPEYMAAARELGRLLARKNLGLVYGGAGVGTMRATADAALEAGGEVIGVMPRFLADKEVAHPGLSDLRIVDSMQTRKQVMAELADGFIALPGGLGTFDELFEVVTWGQLNMHHKPCGILNVCRYYQKLLDFIDHAVLENFVRKEHCQMILVAQTPGGLLDKMATYQAPELTKRLDRNS